MGTDSLIQHFFLHSILESKWISKVQKRTWRQWKGLEKNLPKYQEAQMNSLRWDYRNEFMMHRGSQMMDGWVVWDLDLTSEAGC